MRSVELLLGILETLQGKCVAIKREGTFDTENGKQCFLLVSLSNAPLPNVSLVALWTLRVTHRTH